MTGTIQGTSREHLYHEMGFESLWYQRWTSSKYLANCLNINDNQVYKIRASEHIRRFGTRTENFKQSFFHFCVNEWCKLNISLRKNKNIRRFKSMLNYFFNLKQKSMFAIHDPAGAKYSQGYG